MDSEKYVDWCAVSNTINSRLKNNSLLHTFTRERRIRKSTKLINQVLQHKSWKHTYAQFKKSKQEILEKLTANIDVINISDCTDTYYKSYYDSFDTTLTNLHSEAFKWHKVDKKGSDEHDPEDTEVLYFWEPNIDVNVIKTENDFEKLFTVNKTKRQEPIIGNGNANKKTTTPKNLKSKNTTINSPTVSNNEISSINNKVKARKKVLIIEKQSPKSELISNTSSKDVKKNLTSTLDNVSLRSQELACSEWNDDDFFATEFQAQSTQIFSSTFLEKKAKRWLSIDDKLSREVTNQPRDSGIEEDSREDNAKFENPVNEKEYNKNSKNKKTDKSEALKKRNMDNLNEVGNNLYESEMKKSPYKKVPLKIIGEEKVTKKFTIITNKGEELKPVEEEKKEELLKTESTTIDVKNNPANEKSESSSESDSEFADCHNADDSLYNKSGSCSSDKGSSDEYYDLQDEGSERDPEDSQNENENKNDLQNGGSGGDSDDSQNEHENKKDESDNSSMNQSIIRKRKLKEELKKCKSPFMVRRYNELKKLGVLEESDVESTIKISEKKPKKSFRTCSITPSKTSKIKKISSLKAGAHLQDTPKIQKQAKDDESNEEKTLVAENFNYISPISKQSEQQDLLSTCEDSEERKNESKNNKVIVNVFNSNTPDTKIEKTTKTEKVQNLSKCKEDDSDSIVSETSNSQSSSKSKQYSKNKEKSERHKKQADNDNLSAHEESVEIGNQTDLKNIVNDYKQTLLLPTPPKLTEDLNEINEFSDIGTQFQSMESPVHEDSNDSENSEVEKTVINLKNQNTVQEKKRNSDSKKKDDDSLKIQSSKVKTVNQKAKTLKESSSEEDTSDLEEPSVHTFNANVNKNADSEDEYVMSTKSKENLNNMKRLDLLNSDEDSDDSKDGFVEKSHCNSNNSNVDIEKYKIEDKLSCDSLQEKGKVSLNQLKPSDGDFSNKFYSEISSIKNKTNTSKNKHISSGDSGAVSDIVDTDSNNSKNKSIHKRKFTQIENSEDGNDRESRTSEDIDVENYSSENDLTVERKIKKLKSSNFGASMFTEEENIDILSSNSFKHTKLNPIPSGNESDDSDSDQTMSYSSRQKILRLKKMNLLANNSSSSSEDEKTTENAQNKCKKDHKKGKANKNSALNDSYSDSNSVSKTKKDLHDFNTKINEKQNQMKGNEELHRKGDDNDVEDQKDDKFDDKNCKSEDSEEECTMSSKTKERLNKMKRLDLLKSDEDSDDSKDSNKDDHYINYDVDIEEHKIEDVVAQHDLKKSNESLNSQRNLSGSEKTETVKSKTKTKNSIAEKLINENTNKNEIISEKSAKLISTLVPTDGTEIDSFGKETDERKKSKESNKKVIIQETQETVHSQNSILESQPMFSSLEDLTEGISDKQLNFEVTSDVNSNSLKDTSQNVSTEALLKSFTDKITKISELVEKESLEKITCQSTMSIKSIGADEDIFVLEVPKTMFNENLIGKKFSFSKTTLTVGNSNYEAFQKQVSPSYSCILKTDKKAVDSFTTQNIRPVATIIARRKKFIDDSTNISNNEIDENIHESSSSNEIKTLDNDNNLLKNSNAKKKVTKKLAKKTTKSEEKEVLESPVTLKKKEPKKVTSKKNKFDVNNFAKKTSVASIPDNSKKERKKVQRNVLAHSTDALNNEIAKGENLDKDNLSCFSEDAHSRTTLKKTLLKEVVKTTSKDNPPTKPVKSPGKLKKFKSSKHVEETEDVNELDKKKNTESIKKLSKILTKKRKVESQLSGDANPNEKQETRKKKKVTVEKKEKKSTSKATSSKKNVVDQSGESAADQIRKLIAKNIKFDDSLNGSFDSSNYNPLDIERVPKKPKRCQSTTSSDNSDDDRKFSSFCMRDKSNSKDIKNSSDSEDVKCKDKKSVKKVFFSE